MTEQNINEQILNSPLTKQEAKEQWIKHTKDMDLKHSFTFDEMWDTAAELRKKKEFREQITLAQEALEKNENALTGKELHAYNPVKHTFADDCYIREIFNPAGQIIVTKIHKKEHPFFLMKGKMSILTEDGVVYLEAPHHGITKPGTKRIIYTHTDCIFITVHGTDKKTSQEVEEDVIAKNFDDPVISIEEINLLKEKI
jgi:uncharacterized protein YaiL (DUF2058 family)